MKCTCSKCGDSFTVSKEALILIEEGYVTKDQIAVCDDCFIPEKSTLDDYYEFSDADSGL